LCSGESCPSRDPKDADGGVKKTARKNAPDPAPLMRMKAFAPRFQVPLAPFPVS